jgi:hypothetical protein
MRQLNVLVACEESGAVRDEFRKLGHNAWSCDLQPCDNASPFRDYHLQGSVIDFLDRKYAGLQCFDWSQCFKPKHIDIMIAHPPCTYLCNSGVRWLFRDPAPIQNTTWFLNRTKPIRIATTKGYRLQDHTFTRQTNPARHAALIAAAAFFRRLWSDYEIPFIGVENPIMHSYGKAMCGCGKPTQVIQPWMFGHPETKATCLWLKGLPKLSYNIPAAKMTILAMKFMPRKQTNRIHFASPGPERAKLRSKTYPGIALAMATQWGEYVSNLPLA